MTKTSGRRYVTIFFFLVYALVLIKLILFKHPLGGVVTDVWFSVRTGNYVPLTTIIGYLSGEPSWQIAIVNLLGNIILFVPFGIFLPLIFRSMTGKKVVAYAIVCSVTLEICQIFLMGTPDIDDVFLNTLGALIGYFAWRLVRK